MMSNRTYQRSGMAMAIALVALALIGIILAVVTRQVVAQHRLVEQRHKQLQATWLTRAGVEIAAARLLQSPAVFKTEDAKLLAGATVRIAVEKAEPDVFAVRVEAQVGDMEQASVVKTATARFRRTEAGGVVRLQPLVPPKD